MPKCSKGSNRCKATGACTVKRPPLPAPPGKRFYRCPKGSRQCVNRKCYDSARFKVGPVGDHARAMGAASSITSLLRRHKTRRVAAAAARAAAARTAAARTAAATRVASVYRGHVTRRQAALMARADRTAAEARHATRLAAIFRGRCARLTAAELKKAKVTRVTAQEMAGARPRRTIPQYVCSQRYITNAQGKRVDGPCPRICPNFAIWQDKLYCTKCIGKDERYGKSFSKEEWMRKHSKK